jgi:hypothetical protein
MSRLFAFGIIVAFLVVNIASVAHADCTSDVNCAATQSVAVVDNAGDQHNDHQDDQKQAACDCCATCSGHHHHSHMAYVNGKAEPIMASSQAAHSSEGATYLSQLHYPPSKPPKA